MRRDYASEEASNADRSLSIATRPSDGRRATTLASPISTRTAPSSGPDVSARVGVDGKQFRLGAEPFRFRGVTYGTFASRGDGALFPEREQLKLDFAAMRESGFTVVRTYTPPPDDLVDLSADWGLRVMADVFYPDWRYLVGASRRQYRRVVDEARRAVRDTARRFAGSEQLVALSLGNEIPADVLRWFGARKIAGVIDELVEVVREEDPQQLVTYANYPTAEYLSLPNLDFLTFNVFLERREDFRRYLTRLHHAAGDRPLVLGEVGLDAGTGRTGERRQAAALDWQLETAIERGVAGTCLFSWTDDWSVAGKPVEGWHFGLTRADRSPRPGLRVASKWNDRTVRDLAFDWPTMSVVICAYNAEATLEECLFHTTSLDYPALEIIVIDDGSTDGTAAIARRYNRAQVATIEHSGLAMARNEGLRLATGDLVVYLDSDAYPTPDWPYYLALGLDGPMVAGVGGPNVPPENDPIKAHQVARAPGGPVHVLLSDDRAEHVPGCNMAFWKTALTDFGGFDPIYTSAGDDVDICWKALDRGYDIGFHPAALVWHHRRPGIRPYLRQQLGYGRSEALVEARHPSRFTSAGSARWRGRIYNAATPSLGRQRIYRGQFGTAAFQSGHQSAGHARELLHQLGMPIAVCLMAMLPLGLLTPALFALPIGATTFVVLLGVVDVVQATPPRRMRRDRFKFRLGVAVMHLLQPVVRSWGRVRARPIAWRDVQRPPPLPAVTRSARGVLLFEADRSRAELVASIIGHLRLAGARVQPATGWDDHDARLTVSRLMRGEMVSSGHPVGYIQVRVNRRLHRRTIGVACVVTVATCAVEPLAGVMWMAACLTDMGAGALRLRSWTRAALEVVAREA